mmetsp:Transcript_9797/g.27918  ORF Transcript_9797/g.27918 Transcript_9797/m.27918 type:complete len:210 (+) Transcript_9797:150-779(+)
MLLGGLGTGDEKFSVVLRGRWAGRGSGGFHLLRTARRPLCHCLGPPFLLGTPAEKSLFDSGAQGSRLSLQHALPFGGEPLRFVSKVASPFSSRGWLGCLPTHEAQGALEDFKGSQLAVSHGGLHGRRIFEDFDELVDLLLPNLARLARVKAVHGRLLPLQSLSNQSKAAARGIPGELGDSNARTGPVMRHSQEELLKRISFLSPGERAT